LILVGWLMLAALFLFLAFRKKNKFLTATGSLNLIALVLLAYPLYQGGSVVVRNFNITGRSAQASSVQEVDPVSSEDLPDISLVSTLNMDYVQNLSDKFKADTYNSTQFFELLKHNTVRKTLEAAGYTTIAFETGFYWTEWEDADVFMGPSPLSSDLTSFEELLLKTTMLRVLVDAGRTNAEQISGNHYRERTCFVLDSIPELVKYPGPKFVFIHIVSPHPPFVFGPDGEATDPTDFLNAYQKFSAKSYALGYTNQVAYLNTLLEQVLDTLIIASARPPVIILQGDHGPWMQPENKRFWILNTYYLPWQNKGLYSSISPVNSFRIILDEILG
jgi:hypothetical protein